MRSSSIGLSGLVLLLGCGGGNESTTTFGAGTVGGSAADGLDDDDDDDETSDDDDDASDRGGSTDDGSLDGTTDDTGSDGGPTFECDIAIGCHEGAPVVGAGVGAVVPIGCGGEQFALAQSIDVGAYADPEAPRSVPMLGDLDDDGALDLVVNFRKAGAGYVLAGNGAGSFTEPPAAALDGGLFAGGWGGELGDIDADGTPDVLFGDHTRGGRAWVSLGNMSFGEARNGLPDSVYFSGGGLVELDGDGNLDALLGADQFGSGATVYLGDGAGTWMPTTSPSIPGSNLGQFVPADYDGDGDLDVFAFGKSGPGVTAFVLRNDAGALSVAGQFSGGTGISNADPVQGDIGDVDCDGDLDIAAGGTVYLANAGTWALGATADESKVSHLADMNGDGHLDLVTHDPATGLALYLGDGTGTGFTLDATSGLPAADDLSHGAALDSAYGIDIGDLDGNGALDIVRIGGFAGPYHVDVFVR